MINNALFSEQEINNLKNATDIGEKKLADEMLDAAEKMISGELSPSISFLGFGYYYTGNREYLEKARELMHNQVEKALWVSDEYNPTAYNGYDIRTSLETGSGCIIMAYGISLFGDLLEEDERNYFIEQTYKKGIRAILEDWVLPGHKIHALDTMGHNFWITITSACGLAAIVMKDFIPDGEKNVNDTIRAIKAWFEYKGNPLNAKPQSMDNGGYYESMGYFDFSIHEYLKFAIAYKNITGRHPFDDKDILEAAGKFYINISYSSSTNYCAGFGDCGSCDYRVGPLFLIRYGMGTSDLRWYVQTRTNNNEDRLVELFAWHDIYDTPAEDPKTLSACYDKIGWAIFKDGWGEKSSMLAVKCGDTWNHAHADCASFILFRNGKPELYDSMTATSYSNPLYQKYFVTSDAHNVLLFNGHGQDYRDNYKNHAHIPGRLYNFTDKDGFRYVVADGTGPMSRWFRKHHRHFLWLDGFILVYDDVECYECGKVSFLLHGKENNCFRMLSPATVETKIGYKKDEKEHKCDIEVPYKSYNTMTDDDGHAKFCGVMVLDDSLTPLFEEIENGWKITCGKTKVYINLRADGKVMHRNCISVLDGIVTDAMILVDADGKYAVANGSIVRKDGMSYLDTLARITGWADPDLR